MSLINNIQCAWFQLFSRNLITRQVKEEEESDQDRLDLEATELLREEQGMDHPFHLEWFGWRTIIMEIKINYL